MEMIKFAEVFYPGTKLSTFFESCGVADLITTCYGGRNRKVSEAFVRTKKVTPTFWISLSELRIFVSAAQTIKELEVEMLNGQMLQGPFTAEEVNYMLKAKSMEDRSVFSLFRIKHQ